MEVAGMKPDEETITFTRNEWKYFLDELEMRGLKKVPQCINNARYLAKLDRAEEQARSGKNLLYFTDKGWDDYTSWSDENYDTMLKISDMIMEVKNNTGQFEKLNDESNLYSRRIDEDNDLIYIANADNYTIKSCKGHYGDK